MNYNYNQKLQSQITITNYNHKLKSQITITNYNHKFQLHIKIINNKLQLQLPIDRYYCIVLVRLYNYTMSADYVT